jgi:hypothetical protein
MCVFNYGRETDDHPKKSSLKRSKPYKKKMDFYKAPKMEVGCSD